MKSNTVPTSPHFMPDDQQILALRSSKKNVDSWKPYHFLQEQEIDAYGVVRDVNTIFLTNKECPFKCVMCDLWKTTLDDPTPAGAIPAQIEYALKQLPGGSVIKLYNNGNFFDKKAIPEEDYPAIAHLLSGYDHVIVENHPKLCGNSCLYFKNLLNGTLEIAMGVETVHPEVLPKLNKQITIENVRRAASFLKSNDISFRTFLLLNPPFLTDKQAGIEWVVKSAKFAFAEGAGACSIIPTRGGNGIMEKLQREGNFVPPTLDALETSFEKVLALNNGRVFADIWDLQQFSSCDHCFEQRKTRLHKMNLTQQILPGIVCQYH